MKNQDQIRAIQEIVAGVRPLSSLDLWGIDVHVTEHKSPTSLRREWKFGPCPEIQVEVTPRTIARGMSRLIEHGENVEAWAAFILAAPFISIADTGDQDELIQVIWNASFGEPLTKGDLALIAQYASDAGEDKREG